MIASVAELVRSLRRTPESGLGQQPERTWLGSWCSADGGGLSLSLGCELASFLRIEEWELEAGGLN
jgi:hypothetical protein